MKIAEMIKKTRLSRGLTQVDLASLMRSEGLQTQQETISRWESSRKTPSEGALDALERALGCVFERHALVSLLLERSSIILIDEYRGPKKSRSEFIAWALELWPNHCEDVDDETANEVADGGV